MAPRRFLPLLCAAVVGLLVSAAAAAPGDSATAGIRSLFLFKDVLESNATALATSGFNTLILFSFGVLGNGDVVYYTTNTKAGGSHTTVAANGAYVGGDALAARVQSFKRAPSAAVNRVEICMSSSGTAFQNVSALLRRDGRGPATVLARNFAALRAAWALDAFNNDDESVYDVASTVRFAQLLGAAGYRYTAAPYTNMRFWTAVHAQLNETTPGLLDRIYLQEYDGGAGNNPGTWQTALGRKVVPILWVTNDAKPSQGATAAQAQSQFRAWASRYAVAGGGYWNDYDIEKMGSSYAAYANVLLSVFP